MRHKIIFLAVLTSLFPYGARQVQISQWQKESIFISIGQSGKCTCAIGVFENCVCISVSQLLRGTLTMMGTEIVALAWNSIFSCKWWRMLVLSREWLYLFKDIRTRDVWRPVFSWIAITLGPDSRKYSSQKVDNRCQKNDKFTTDVNDTGDKFFTGVTDTGGKFIAGVNDTGDEKVETTSGSLPF